MDIRDAVAWSILFSSSRTQLPEAVRQRLLLQPRAFVDQVGVRTLEELLRSIGLTDSAELRSQVRRLADAALTRGRRAGIEAISIADGRYPPLLSAIFDPPAVIWIAGRVDALRRTAVAIVGSRAASPYALEVAERLGTDLARRGVLVVSGLARGVDSAAHRGALAGGGETVAVLGSGADVVYPSEHTALAAQIVGSGAVVSELPPGTPPCKSHFPRRNRLISGLSEAVVVIEASERSGSLITAACALEQGRDVMAVPGNVLNGRNRGSHSLLRDGAKVVESVDDILEELRPGPSAGGNGRPAAGRPAEGASGDPLLRCMETGESYDLDDLVSRCRESGATLLPRLLQLELEGLVRRVGAGRFVRSRQAC